MDVVADQAREAAKGDVPSAGRTRLAIVEHQPIVVWGLGRFFAEHEEFEIVGDAADVSTGAEPVAPLTAPASRSPICCSSGSSPST